MKLFKPLMLILISASLFVSCTNDELENKIADLQADSLATANQLDDKEELEDYLILALNKALKRAGEINEQELAVAAKSGMPNIPGMDMFK